jgi:hypothetical protein
MKYYSCAVLLLISCLSCISSYCVAQNNIEGEWVGGIETANTWILTKIRFTDKKNGLKGKIDIDAPPPYFSGTNLSLGKVILNNDSINFDFFDIVKFRGIQKKNSISGSFSSPEGGGKFSLVPAFSIYPHLLDDYSGTYKSTSGDLIFIRKSSMGGLSYYNYTSGRYGQVFPSSDFSFFGGPANKIPIPKEVFLNFKTKANKDTELILSENGTRNIIAKKVSLFNEEEVFFNNDTIKLSGTLLSPLKKGRHPAIVFISQSTSPTSRKALLSLAVPFAARGIAVLIYDKRGQGGSTGDWRYASMTDFANDAIAGIKFLKQNKNIDPGKIGIYAQSQGGMIAPIIANQLTDLSFILAISPVCIRVQDNATFTTAKQLEAENFSSEVISEAVEFQTTINAFAASKITWNDYIKHRRSHQNKSWFSYISAPSKPDDWSWNLLRENFDPTPLWRNVSVPVLAIFGGVDVFMDAKKSRENLENNLKIGKNKNYSIKFYPEGDHGLREAKIGNMKESPYLKKYVNNFYPLIVNWVVAQTRL